MANSPSNPVTGSLQRYLFWPFWFLLVPAGLAWFTVQLLSGGDSMSTGFLSQLRYLVQDQQVPAAIAFFTLYEMVIYHFRHSLPMGGDLMVGGRGDVPRDRRRDFERAVHLLEDAERVLKRNPGRVKRELSLEARAEVDHSLERLREALHRTPLDLDEFEAAEERARSAVSEHLSRWQKSDLREYFESIAIAFAVALLLRAFVVEAFKIPSGSMLPTLQIQDHIFVNKLSYGPSVPFTKTRFFSTMPPKRGDVMVFIYPDQDPTAEPQDFIKRAIATEGDVLEVEGGHPIINGWPVPRCRVGSYQFHTGATNRERGELYMEYLGDYSYLTLYEEGKFEGRQGPYRVAPGEVWVLGDNRNNSSDSRAWYGGKGGGVPYANIKGRAMFVWLAFTYQGPINFGRIFTDVLGKPAIPPEATPEIANKIAECLANRPAQTLPPPPSGQSPTAESSVAP